MTGNLTTFDLVDIQLYESYSPANRGITSGATQPAAQYLVAWIRAVQRGWTVNFSEVPEVQYANAHVSVEASRLVVGFSHGNAKPPHGKSLFIEPSAVAEAWAALSPEERPRGLMFWNLENDGGPAWFANGSRTNVGFASEFNRILRIR